MDLNGAIFQFFYNWANKNILVDILIVFFGQYLLYILVLIAGSMIFLEKDRQKRYYFAVLTILTLILSNGILVPLLNYFFYNPRPFMALTGLKTLISHGNNSSFPSGHMMFITPVALTIFYMNKKMGYWFFAGVFLMGIARIAGGVHWPLDILGGIIIGALCFYLVKWLLFLGGLKEK